MVRFQYVAWLTVLCLAAAFTGNSALAWEVNLEGEFAYEYRYVTQSGVGGFFGPHDQNKAHPTSAYVARCMAYILSVKNA